LLYDAGWCQGAILPTAVAVSIRPDTVPEQYQHAILITQDCNIVADNHKESRVEIAFGYSPPDAENANAVANSRHPRLFLTTLSSGTRFIWDVRERITVTKIALNMAIGSTPPLGRPIDSDLREFRAWLGRRYSRPAFPDAFNERLRSASATIDKAIKSDGFRSVLGVFYLIAERDEELLANDPYHLYIIFCFADNGTASPLPQTAIEIERYVRAVAACTGISLMKSDAISDARFPIQYLRSFELVDFDSRSYGHPESALPR
jgi:hypothetical protein